MINGWTSLNKKTSMLLLLQRSSCPYFSGTKYKRLVRDKKVKIKKDRKK